VFYAQDTQDEKGSKTQKRPDNSHETAPQLVRNGLWG
jgi:hypothetical protein